MERHELLEIISGPSAIPLMAKYETNGDQDISS